MNLCWHVQAFYGETKAVYDELDLLKQTIYSQERKTLALESELVLTTTTLVVMALNVHSLLIGCPLFCVDGDCRRKRKRCSSTFSKKCRLLST